MNILSLFGGVESGRIAVDRAKIKVDNYYSSEIDNTAIKIANHNYSDLKNLGDVKSVRIPKGHKIDIIFGGSPCQGFSFAGKQLKFDDPRSMLFFEYARILKECKRYNPDVEFLLENVVMDQMCQDVISEHLGVSPIEINSNKVSAQNRKRLYWTNIPNIQQPEDKGVLLYEILETGTFKEFDISMYNPVTKKNYVQWDVSGKGYNSQQDRAFYENGKFGCFPSARATTKRKICVDGSFRKYRNLTVTECERLQTLPDGYTQVLGVSEGQSLIAIGNGWTVDVISHILKNSVHAELP